MDIKEFAQTLDNRQYAYPQFTKEELQTAKDNGFVIVCGASDDLMEFYGALEDEGDCFDGGTVWFDKERVLDGPAATGDKSIEALWCDKNSKDKNGNVITWTYKTDIPHETFMIYEDEEPYCRGIVFKLEDIK
jgi:hypothetical protein